MGGEQAQQHQQQQERQQWAQLKAGIPGSFYKPSIARSLSCALFVHCTCARPNSLSHCLSLFLFLPTAVTGNDKKHYIHSAFSVARLNVSQKLMNQLFCTTLDPFSRQLEGQAKQAGRQERQSLYSCLNWIRCLSSAAPATQLSLAGSPAQPEGRQAP